MPTAGFGYEAAPKPKGKHPPKPPRNPFTHPRPR